MTQQITIKCTRDASDKEADAITDALITTEAAAVARGKRFLDDPNQGGYYRAATYQFTAPHKGANITPGAWITVSIARLGIIDATMKVTAYAIAITDRSVMANITAVRYIAP